MVRSSNIISAVTAALTAGVLAEYRIYYGLDTAFGGDQGSFYDATLFLMPGNAEPSCGDIEDNTVKRIVTAGTGDLTETGGFVCEGCDMGSKEVWNFEIDRLEFEDSDEHPKTSEHPGVITLYPSDTKGVFDIVHFDEPDGEIVGNGGTCTQTESSNADTFECLHFGSWSGVHLFTCDGDVYDE
ncbi:hypothetical protein NLU13_3558 [Sarocladium strictum]|uniref:Uncharacterized protein n=1 Tax=Sarocladium strictum TaxID=5046 RepID=A0AA39GM89_SARSR|nr:hypothetical protein NLU13_3558 [Sarocladium strictum]